MDNQSNAVTNAARYDLPQLADLARKDEIPALFYSKYKNAKELLMNYPRSLRNYARFAIIPMLLIVTVGTAAVFVSTLGLGTFGHGTFDPQAPHAKTRFIMAELLAVVTFAVSEVIFFWISRRDMKHRRDQADLEQMCLKLADLVNWTGYYPAQLSSLADVDLAYLTRRLMVDACKKVLVFQKEHAHEDPTIGAPERKSLMDDVKNKYDVLRSLELVAGGGHGCYYEEAGFELAYEAAGQSLAS